MHDRHWLSLEGLRLLACLMLAFFLVFGFGLVWYSNFVAPNGYVISSDHVAFWEASKFALEGRAADAYDPATFMAAAKKIDAGKKNFGWFYPPTFFLAILPLGLLTYFQSFLAFMATTLAFYFASIRKIIRGSDAMLFLLASPGLWLNLRMAQNGFLTAGMAGFALCALESHPIVSGVLIGLLSMKPHLALLFPLALIANRSWKTFISAAISAAIFMVVSILALGIDTFPAWIGSLNQTRIMYLENPQVPIGMVSTFSMLRILGAPLDASYLGQLITAAYAAVSVWKVWRSSASNNIKFSVLVIATLLVTPYLYFYDLTWLSLGIAWMAKSGLEEGWRTGDREVLAAAWLLPLVSYLTIWIHLLALLQLGILLLLTVALRRAGFTVLLRKR